MIRYALKCVEGHAFEGWFRDAHGFEQERDSGRLACAECGSAKVDRALMAPNVATGRKAEAPMTLSPAEKSMAELRRRIEAESTYVGKGFAAEARAMHEGASEHKAIHGEAAPAEARKLIEDGVPIAPLPFVPRQKAN